MTISFFDLDKNFQFGKEAISFYLFELKLDDFNRRFPDEKLTILCEFCFNYEKNSIFHGSGSRDQLVASGKEQTLSGLAVLYKSGHHADTVFSFKSTDQVLKAHKAILVAASPVFGAMFQHEDTKETKEGCIHICDARIEVFDIFLMYLYSGNGDSPLIDQFADELLTISNKVRFYEKIYFYDQVLC